MSSREMSRRIGLLLGGAAIVGMAATSAGCSKGGEADQDAGAHQEFRRALAVGQFACTAPSGAPVSPTEKADLTPGRPQPFTPSVPRRRPDRAARQRHHRRRITRQGRLPARAGSGGARHRSTR